MSDTTLQRFIDHIQTAIGNGTLTATTGEPSNLQQFKRAIPIAKSIVLFTDPLDACNEALGGYIGAAHKAINALPDDPTDPDHETEKAAATETAIYFVALAVGLLVADQVRA